MLGLALVFLATIFGSAKDLLSKKISFVVHGTLSAFLSFVMALPWYGLIFLIAYLFNIDLYAYSGEFFTYIFLRAFIDAFAELTKMHAVASGEISFVSNFFSLTPIFILFLAPLITGESITTTGLIGVLIIFIGTAILFTGPKEKIPWAGVCLGLVSSLLMSVNTCLDRLAATNGNPIFSGFLMTALSALILLPASYKLFAKHKIIELSAWPLLLRGLFEVLFMCIKLAGLQYLEPQYAAGVGKLTLVLSVIIGGGIFNESDRNKRIISALIIVFGSVIVALAKFYG